MNDQKDLNVNMVSLKSCPLCNGDSRFKVLSNERIQREEDYTVVFSLTAKCRNCGLETPEIHRLELSILPNGIIEIKNDGRKSLLERWNNRPKIAEDTGPKEYVVDMKASPIK